MHTGIFQFLRPSARGVDALRPGHRERRTCPASSRSARRPTTAGRRTTAAPFLPAVYQGTRIGGAAAGRSPAADDRATSRTRGSRPAAQRLQLDFVQSLNRERARARRGQPGDRGGDRVVRAGLPHAGRAAEADGPGGRDRGDARRSTASATQATDDFGRQCLLARRFVEAGVRFVEVTPRRLGPAPQPEGRARPATPPPIDKPIAGLLADLKQRGLLKDTLVIWGGEFGRTPYAQGSDGRDHNTQGLHHLDGRRRRARAAWPTARPTTTATRPSRTRSTSTTGTRPSCTCSGSTTRS